ncbi:Peptidyl-prolyl cis-trans isomerase CYP38, chloroplastic [Linum perenne]
MLLSKLLISIYPSLLQSLAPFSRLFFSFFWTLSVLSPPHSALSPLSMAAAVAAAAGASIRCYSSSISPASHPILNTKSSRTHIALPNHITSFSCRGKRLARVTCSLNSRPTQFSNEQRRADKSFTLKECAISVALAVGLITGMPSMENLCPPNANAATNNRALPDVSVLISGPPIKDPGALLRYALPIDNKAIREVQKPLEDITDSLKIAGLKALDSVERNVKQASRALQQGKALIIAGLAEPKRAGGVEVLDKLETGLNELQQIVESRNRDAVAPKQKELLDYVGRWEFLPQCLVIYVVKVIGLCVEEDMVNGFPYEVPEEYRNMPLLKGRATVDMKVKVKDNPNLQDCVFRIVLDGYSAPVTAGNFVDLVERHFYDGMQIQRADGFVVQTGDPEGPAEGFIDPSTEKTRTIPLEIMVEGEKAPFYGATLEVWFFTPSFESFPESTLYWNIANHVTLQELGLYKAQTKLPFNAFGTMAMARDEFEDNSASSQVFWLLKESELTPSNANILDGRYSVFGYITQNEELLADLKVGDVIESIQVVAGLENLANPSYKIAG